VLLSQVCTLYIGPFRNAVNLGSSERYFDMPIGQAFIANWRSSKTGPTKQLHEAILKLTEDIRRIFSFRQLEINAMDNNQTMQLFVDGKSYFLPELGSGLSHFILVLGTAAFRRPSYILIDEPTWILPTPFGQNLNPEHRRPTASLVPLSINTMT
jgi:hypothetical protein